ncbi:DUF1214 domain-containing protein [Flammeovirga yaeyamensis]|uniref:DUF1214 domain-containing protein n=1 Tax=Flammeovirga yaeyamensis TaxID=367791 RepID=A0AAX1NCU3_9BACT|nr:DUF1214 domain-containing protein [Flammeovirga yaeyamensis]MBB3696750.1 hypothetical protein [Flammeovirga yaeyamensis]NMF33418.1 DUF1254 domain-containing protein [Flammeovirga yaeyamensis]QWG05307.1 DUF1214 domain-containing protein [Flammeovirga yaeyamensis]
MKKIFYYLMAFTLGFSTLTMAQQKDNFLATQPVYLDNGYLDNESVEDLRKTQMYVKAVSAYEFALPIVGLEQWRKNFLKEAEYGDFLLYDNLDQKISIITANKTTPYTVSFVDLRTSAYYIEIPAGRIGGLLLDNYQRPQADLGILGPDKGKGGKYLVVGPEDNVPENHDADYVIKSTTNVIFFGTRIIGAKDAEEVDKLRKQHFVYKITDSKEGQKWIDATATPEWRGRQSRDLEYWEDLYNALVMETVEGVNRLIWTQLRDLGITKSGGFHPNKEEQEILIMATQKGEAIAMVQTFSKKSYKSKHWEDRNWRYILNQSRLDLMHEDYYEAKEIASFTYEAITTSKGMVLPTVGQGSKYLGVYVDGDEEWLDGSNTYEIIIPKDVPAADFWSIAVYNNDTRCLIENESKKSIVNNKREIKVEKDGSVKVFIGPECPKGYEANWVESNKGEGFFMYFRLYGPLESYYDKTWKMSDVNRVK